MNAPVRWVYSPGLVPVYKSEKMMVAAATSIACGKTPELIWVLQHESCYTLGAVLTQRDSPIAILGAPVVETQRGGKITYHGPGQCVIYGMINLRSRELSMAEYVDLLETWLIEVLVGVGVKAFSGGVDRRGIWAIWGDQEIKVASIGLRVRQGVTLYGLALNVAPDMRYFRAIQPCGLSPDRVGSLESLGIKISLDDIVGRVQQTCPWKPLEILDKVEEASDLREEKMGQDLTDWVIKKENTEDSSISFTFLSRGGTSDAP